MEYVSYTDEGYGHLAGVELGSAGMAWPAAIPFSPTIADLADVVTAANEDPHVQIPRLKIGHYSWINGEMTLVNPFDGLADDGAAPSFGAVTNLRTANDGAVILGDFIEVPVWLADAMPSAYRNRSGEWRWNVETPGDKTYRLVLTHMALLGLKLPAIQDLEDLERLLTDGPETVETADAPTPTQEANVPADQIDTSVSVDVIRRRANNDWAMGDDRLFEHDGETVDPYWWWARDIRVDPNEIVMDDDEGGLWLLAYSTDGEDNITFEQPVPVREVFVPVNTDADDKSVVKTALTKAGQRVLTSNLERPEKQAPSKAAQRPETTTHTQEDSMTTIDIAALRERTGLTAEQLPDDATDEQINAALAAPAAEPETPETPEVEETPETPETVETAATTVTVDKAQWDETRTMAEQGAEIAKTTREREDRQAIETALTEGRFPPARREHYERLLETDRDGTLTLLTAAEDQGGLAKGLVPVDEEIGIGGNGDDDVVATGEDGLLPESHSNLTPAERARLANR